MSVKEAWPLCVSLGKGGVAFLSHTVKNVIINLLGFENCCGIRQKKPGP